MTETWETAIQPLPPPERFKTLLESCVQELFEDNQPRMTRAELFATRHVVADDDLQRFFVGLEHGCVTLARGGRFNTLDRPTKGGRWGLLSREKAGCRYNAEYLPQIAAYVTAIHELGYPAERVFFELPHRALKLDMAIVSDDGAVFVLGEAKRAVSKLDAILAEVRNRYSAADPGEEGRNEARQLAWRLWRTRAPYLWLIGPAERRAYRVRYEPLEFEALPALPRANEVGLTHVPKGRLAVPILRPRPSPNIECTGPGLALLAPAGDRERSPRSDGIRIDGGLLSLASLEESAGIDNRH